MIKQRLFIFNALIISIATLFLSVSPLTTFADPSSNTCTPPSSSQPGVHVPVGADASLYTYNCTTGLWTSSEFTFNPSTGAYTPINPVVYTYNSTTGEYDATVWVYSAPQKNYVQNTISVTQPPAGADVVGGPAPATATDPSDTIAGTGDDSNNNISGDANGDGTQGISNTGDDSNNNIDNNGTNDTTDSNTNNLAMNNQISQQTNSGNAILLGNTTAGNATSGNADDEANIVNMLQSSASELGSNVVTFTANIDGNVNGDLLLDPSVLGTPQNTDPTGDNNLTVNNSTNAAINNNIDLNANSGNATESQNTTAGNATSGSAEAIANVVNLINSAITSGKSFIGTININGDLNGNIVVPPDFINQLLATNVPTVTITDTGADSNNNVSDPTSNNTDITNTNNQGITNNVNANATSGQATAGENTTVGNVTSGSANTGITAFNLTGSNIIGSNDLLVFVNDMGTWVGMILNAPAGATAAEFGGGVVSDTGSGSNNNIDSSGNNTTNEDNNTNEQINNNINVNAQSGSASANQNTTAGNVTSGNADAAVNLLNIDGSTISLANWFGILFINVFGTWNGNFGIETPTSVTTPIAGTTGTGSTSPLAAFNFIPSGSKSFSIVPLTTGSTSGGSSNTSNTSSLAASLVKSDLGNQKAPTPQLTSGHFNWLLAASGGALFLVVAGGDRLYRSILRRLHLRTSAKTQL